MNSKQSGASFGSSTTGGRRPLSRRQLLRSVAAIGAVAGLGKAGILPTPAIAQEPQGEIVIWNRSGDLFKVFDAAIGSFTQRYPKVKVRHLQVDIDAKLPTTLITGAGVPDGSFWDDAKIPGYAEHLTDLTERIAPYKADTAPYKIGVNTIDGKIFGVPWDLDPGLLYYRADILEKAGVDPASLSTYDDLLAASRAIKERVNAEARPIHFDENSFLGQLWLEMFANQQGTSMADAGGKLRLDSDAYRQILGWIQSAANDGLVTRANYLQPGDIATLENGQQAFVPWAIWWSFAPQQLLKESAGKWRATVLPAWKTGGARSGAMGGASFIIPAKAQNPDLAWLLYEYLVYKPEGYTAVYGPNAIYPGGLCTSVPAYLPALDPDKPLFRPIAGLGNQDLWKVAVEAAAQIPGAAPLPSWWARAVDYLGSNLQQLMNGQMTPDEAIVQSSEAIQRNLVDRS